MAGARPGGLRRPMIRSVNPTRVERSDKGPSAQGYQAPLPSAHVSNLSFLFIGPGSALGSVALLPPVAAARAGPPFEVPGAVLVPGAASDLRRLPVRWVQCAGSARQPPW